ncbi:phage holin family protein [Mycetocola reblochoni]|uniref:Phage holin family protein n=2 Tax=Mycetocola reblochoni TaxID=331618 RepID=A0A3L6ZTC7_9MICO|nr:phage holin family protein [Mycetocola reblochoni]RLP71138.1 phage holin family protein [Mycetocola reblochoni]SJN22545.1 putative integral membrane protein [Mycetocola reblochoni REB411]
MAREHAQGPEQRSLFGLIGSLPELVSQLVKAEIAQIKQQYTHKVKFAGIGAALFAGAAVFVYFAVGVLIAVLVLAFATFLPAWLAALIVFLIFVLIAVVLALIGLRFFKKVGQEPGASDNLHDDMNAVKGLGDYER